MTRRRAGGRAWPGARAFGARVGHVLAAAAVAALVSARVGAGTEGPAQPVVLEDAAMAGTEHYCAGYETTFHGAWEAGDGGGAGDGADSAAVPPVLFRIGVNADGAACYAQLNVRTPPGVAPYELPRFRATEGDGGVWTLRYRGRVLEVDTARGAVVRRDGEKVTRSGVLLPDPPAIGERRPPPSARQRERWYGWWQGRFPGAPFPIALRFSGAEAGQVRGRISMLLMADTFMGWHHGEMLIFRWKNRHVGLLMETDGDTLVYTDYKGRISRFRRAR